MQSNSNRSNLWFLLPIFVGIIGGIAAYLILRKDDPEKAKNCIYLALILVIRDLMMLTVLLGYQPGLQDGLKVNV